MKKELLCPVGNMESLFQAVNNGCDAVYLAGKRFGARKYANNFDNDEIVKAIKYCHLYGIKIYITVNILIFEDELEEAINYIEFLYKNGVDALIMQDLGLISVTRQKFPNLDIHASTQMHSFNRFSLLFLKRLGIKRVVLAREMSLEDINKLDVDIEKEIFIHGALCISYSGCCLFSSMLGLRSGNRGECTACCRLPYNLYKDEEEIKTEGSYLLSTKELSTLNNIKEILESNVVSLKIEGRMKSPTYVGYITKLYRELIDKYYNKQNLELKEENISNLKKLFNRKFTSGHLFNNNDMDIMNISSPNHLGVELGKVIYYDKKIIKIKLEDDLSQEDGIRLNDVGMFVNRLYNEKGLLVNKVLKGNIAVLDNKINLNDYCMVSKTVDKKLVEQLENYSKKRIMISLKASLKIGKKAKYSISDNINTFEIEGDIVEKSINASTTKERIIEQLSKLGNTPFIIDSIDVIMDENIFLPIKSLNDCRRVLVEKLIDEREKPKSNIIINDIVDEYYEENNNKLNISVLVRNEEQFIAVKNHHLINNIYVTDYNLYKENIDDSRIIYKVPRICNSYNDADNVLVGDTAALEYYQEKKISTDYYLNITNSRSVEMLLKNKVDRITISVECNYNNIKDLMKHNYPVELVIYGRIELMVTKYCPLNLLVAKGNEQCRLCLDKNNYYFKDEKDNKYPFITNNHITSIFNSRNTDNIDDINKYIDLGIKNFRLELFDENNEEIIELLDRIEKYYE